MFEDKIEIKTYKVKAMCTNCYLGEMKPTGGYILISLPMKYPHVCNKCNHREEYIETYPCIRYEEV